MIAMKEIRATLTNVLKNKAGFTYEVHFDTVKESSKSYFYIEISSRRKTFDPVYYERFLTIDIQLRLLPDEFNRVHRSELYDAEDKLDSTIRPVVQVRDRYITVQDVRSRIIDGILHYQFNLDFADYLPIEIPPFMENLDLDLSVQNLKLELKEESEDGE